MEAKLSWTAIVGAYLAGSIPIGLLTARLVAGIDIRQHGSGNIGATNVARVVGGRWGAFVLLADACKGFLPTYFLPRLTSDAPSPHLFVLCGIAAISGHIFPCWLRFRGGKGVATALGVILVLGPWASLAALAAFLLTYAASRYVALSSINASIAFGVTELILLLPQPFSAEHWSLALFSLAVPALIILRHRSNIGRLLKGKEPRMSFGGTRGHDAEPAEEPETNVENDTDAN